LELVLNGCGFVAVNTVGEVNELVGVVDARNNENSNYGTVLKPPAAFGPPGLAALLATLRCLTSSGRNRNAAARFTHPDSTAPLAVRRSNSHADPRVKPRPPNNEFNELLSRLNTRQTVTVTVTNTSSNANAS